MAVSEDLASCLLAAIDDYERSSLSTVDIDISEDSESAQSPGWYEAHCWERDCEWHTSDRKSVVKDAAWEHARAHRPEIGRRCAADRKMVALHSVRSGTGGTWDTDPPAICNEDRDLHPCDTLRLLAEGYGLEVES